MANIIVGCAKYMMLFLIAIYTFQCFSVFSYEEEKERITVYRNQIFVIFAILAVLLVLAAIFAPVLSGGVDPTAGNLADSIICR